jgi:hypothetical protein
VGDHRVAAEAALAGGRGGELRERDDEGEGGPFRPGQLVQALRAQAVDRQLALAQEGELAAGLVEGAAQSTRGLATLAPRLSLPLAASVARSPRHGRWHDAWQIALTPDGRHLLADHQDDFLRLWEIASGREVWRQTRNDSGVVAGSDLVRDKQCLYAILSGTVFSNEHGRIRDGFQRRWRKVRPIRLVLVIQTSQFTIVRLGN